MTVLTPTVRVVSRTTTRRARVLMATIGAIVALLLFGAGAAFAYWSYTDSSNAYDTLAVADSIPQGATPGTPTTNAPNGNTVSLSFSQVSTASGQLKITSYTVTRYPAAGGSGTVTSATCSITSGTVNCQESSVPNGTWVYTDTPYISGTSWAGTESAKSPSVTIDATTPTASAPIVAATTTYVSGSITWVNKLPGEDVTLTDTATDTGGTGVASVTYYYCSSSPCTPSSLNEIGSSSSSATNWQVPWSSLPADGTYYVVAVATGDNTSVSATSATTEVGVDSTPPTNLTPSVNGYQ